MNKTGLFIGIFEIIIGILAISSYIVLLIGKEDITKWTITLILAIIFLIIGIIEVMNYLKDGGKNENIKK